jgi:CheY-like chemotaxis protein
MTMGSGGALVVVVDDDFDIRAMLTMVLEIEGYRVLAAANGRDALEKLRDRPSPSLIVLDLMMPVMNGAQFRAAQRSSPELAAVPVVVLTGDGATAEMSATLDACAWLRKPIKLDTLLTTIRRCLATPLRS